MFIVIVKNTQKFKLVHLYRPEVHNLFGPISRSVLFLWTRGPKTKL